MKKIFLLGFALLVLSGCQSVPPLNFSIQNVAVSDKKIDAELKSITVSLAHPDEKKGDIEVGMESVPQLWKSSLEESLNRMAIFKDDSTNKINLSVKILAVDMPAGGFDMKTKTIARYDLIERNTGRIVYTQEVTAVGIVPVGYAFYGVVRAMESVNRSVQNNISEFLNSIKVEPLNL
ncbi:lipoprotein [Budvicia aquatica]|uniref:Type IV secretion system putative lipoprotein virB7 n=1 Tax=Budvicia aquatica TaxID=82979 RepID=A0A2C6DRP1_9GAMM|nr:lipoprotein [Budvicia aquatica]PHI30992.1 UDP-N-acetylglucosamine acyltransferase [Budvicia aquatica]VFS51103.1 Uncharacterised protein [Budvicia aquatica]